MHYVEQQPINHGDLKLIWQKMVSSIRIYVTNKIFLIELYSRKIDTISCPFSCTHDHHDVGVMWQ